MLWEPIKFEKDRFLDKKTELWSDKITRKIAVSRIILFLFLMNLNIYLSIHHFLKINQKKNIDML